MPKIQIPTALQDSDNDDFDDEDGPQTERINEPKPISIYDMLNTTHLNRIAISIFAQEFIISHRLSKI